MERKGLGICYMCGKDLGATCIIRDNYFFCSQSCCNAYPDIKKTAKDTQIGGDHYKKMGDYQPWQVAAEWLTPEELRGYMKGTVIAYLAREQDKGKDLDIEKALHTMQLFQEVRKDKQLCAMDVVQQRKLNGNVSKPTPPYHPNLPKVQPVTTLIYQKTVP